MKVYDILMQKIEGIQRRLPLQMRVPERLSFKKIFQSTVNSGKNTAGTVRPGSFTAAAGGRLPVDSRTMAYIETCVEQASQKYGIGADLIKAVIKHESGFNPGAVSTAGAEGLMQLMPETARLVGVKDSFDIRQNIDGGTRFLKEMLDAFDGDLELALAAYNAGPSTVRRYGGIPPYEETEKYVENVMRDLGLR